MKVEELREAVATHDYGGEVLRATLCRTYGALFLGLESQPLRAGLICGAPSALVMGGGGRGSKDPPLHRVTPRAGKDAEALTGRWHESQRYMGERDETSERQAA